MRVTIVLTLLFLSLMQAACSHDTNSDSAGPDSGSDPAASLSATPAFLDNPVVARISGKDILQSDIDERAQLELFKLEWAKYETRRLALAEHLDEKLQGKPTEDASVEVLIRPPQPPRLDWSRPGTQPGKGRSDAPIELSVFCNYQSTHCVGMQDTYAQLEQIYGDRIRFVYYDFPLRFHRFSVGASQAARCAFSGGEFERFHKALWVDPNNLNKDAYLRIAKQLKLDQAGFEACLDSAEVENAIRGNVALAQELGFSNVPVTLINGLYLNGPKDLHVLRFFIDQELERLAASGADSGTGMAGSMSGEEKLEDTALPLRLEGVIGAGNDDNGASARALILKTESDETGDYKVADLVLENVILLEIHPRHVVLDNHGKKEKLRLAHGNTGVAENQAAATDEPLNEIDQPDLEKRLNDIEQAVIASGNVLDTDELPPADIEYQYRGVVAPKGESPLSREWLDDQLVAQSSLRAHFQPGELEVEGVHLLKLKGVKDSEFYQTLGLREGDVVMRVNGEWVHEAQNNLFDALETEEKVSVIVMRKGLPVHYQYAIN